MNVVRTTRVIENVVRNHSYMRGQGPKYESKRAYRVTHFTETIHPLKNDSNTYFFLFSVLRSRGNWEGNFPLLPREDEIRRFCDRVGKAKGSFGCPGFLRKMKNWPHADLFQEAFHADKVVGILSKAPKPLPFSRRILGIIAHCENMRPKDCSRVFITGDQSLLNSQRSKPSERFVWISIPVQVKKTSYIRGNLKYHELWKIFSNYLQLVEIDWNLIFLFAILSNSSLGDKNLRNIILVFARHSKLKNARLKKNCFERLFQIQQRKKLSNIFTDYDNSRHFRGEIYYDIYENV